MTGLDFGLIVERQREPVVNLRLTADRALLT
jgi:hypothetical protein